jgi:predicted permease
VSIKKTLIISFARLIGGPIIAFAVIKFFGLTGYQAGVLFIQCSMPAAVLTYLLAKMYSPKEQADNIASVIATSTFASVVTIPVIVFFALTAFVYVACFMFFNIPFVFFFWRFFFIFC